MALIAQPRVKYDATRLVLALVVGLLVAVPFIVASSARAETLEPISLRLDFLPTGYHAPLFLGVAKGYYKDQGIDLQIADGKGTNVALQSVVAGNDLIVLANYSTMAQSVAKGMPVIAIGGLVQRLPDSVISLKGSGIKTPKDLEGRAMTIAPTSAVFKLFAAFTVATGIDASKIRLIQADPNAVLAALLQGQVDCATGWAFTDALKVAAQKPIEPPMLLSDYGVNVLGTGFVVQKDTATAKAGLIRRFMTATAMSYAVGTKDPDAAIDAMVAARPNVDHDLMLSQFKLFPRFLNTDRSMGHGFGWMSDEDWVQTVDLLKKYFDMTENVEVASLYTNEFLPGK